jgi:hypothetical protein
MEAWTVMSEAAESAAQSAVKMVAVVVKAVVAATAKPQTIPSATAKWSTTIPHSKLKATVDLTAAIAAAVEVQVTERVAAATP